MNRRSRYFRLLQEPGELRTATHAPGDPSEKRDHLIVPVVALVEGVIFPVNAETPELVLADELAPTVGAWNGEPVCFDHPNVNGTRISANDPTILERFMVGRLFNARMDGDRLKVEAWLDTKRCESMGGQALELLERIRAGELVEVSVGAFVVAERLEGVHDGKRFAAVWREIGPDHLAMLPAGVEGACSVGMGCGAPRAAAAGEDGQEDPLPGLLHAMTPDGLLLATEHTEEGPVTRGSTEGGLGKIRTLVEQVKGLGRFLLRGAQGDLSDSDVREILHAALFANEPAFVGVEAVYPETNEVVYLVAPDDAMQWFSRGYQISESRDVTFGDATEVAPTTTFEPVTAAACGCDDPAACHCGTPPAPEDTSMDKKERIAALIANENTHYTDEHQVELEACSEETLAVLEAAAVEEPQGDPKPQDAAPSDPKPAPAQPEVDDDDDDDEGEPAEPAAAAAAKPKVLSAEEFFAMAPPEIRGPLQRALAQSAAQKLQLIEHLVTAQDVHDREALEAMDIEDLEKVQRLCKAGEPESAQIVDFSGFGLPRASSAKKSETIDPAPSLRTAMQEANAK